MRKKQSKLIAFLIILCLAVSLLGHFSDTLTAQAAGPSLNATKVTIFTGTTFQLKVQNVDNSQVKSQTWKANRTTIAKVDQNGVVTPVSAGTTTIKCTITYQNGKSELLECAVTVRKRIACTSIQITNAQLNEGNAQTIYVGEKFSIKKKPTPSNTTDKVFWISWDEDIATVSSGVVTAKKEGFAVIEVRVGVDETDAMRADNPAVDRLYMHVVKKPLPTSTPIPTATPIPTSTPIPTPSLTPTPTPTPTLAPAAMPKVQSAVMVGSQELQITFDRPVRKSSVISGGRLAAGTVIIGRDEGAGDFGTLTPSLSADQRCLTLNSSNGFSGTYSVVVSNKVVSSDGVAFEQYAEVLRLKDTSGPVYSGTTVGYNGWFSNINFNEALDISRMTVESVTNTTDVALLSYLRDSSNYRLSEDKKSIIINLEGVTTNRSLAVLVSLRGICDLSGNTTSSLLQRVYVRTDANTKAVASIVKAERISKTELEVTFDSPIQWPGVARFGNESNAGIVDSENMMIVRYEIPYSYQNKTGAQLIEFSNWYNYNGSLTDTKLMRAVDFTMDTTPPQLTNAELVNGTWNGMNVSRLVLTWHKEIANAVFDAVFSIRVKTTRGEIMTVQPVIMDVKIEGESVTYILSDEMLLAEGEFTVTLPAGLVKDRLDNVSTARVIAVNKNGGDSDELPPPTTIEQDMNDKSVIRLSFDNKLDLASAEEITNYHVLRANGTRVVPIAATFVSQTDTNAVLELTFASGTFTGDSIDTYELVMQNIKGYNGTYGPMTERHMTFQAVENMPPTARANKLQAQTIIMTMSEEVLGSIRITATDSTGRSISGEGYASGSTIYIILSEMPTLTSKTLRFNITENNIVDINGNKAALNMSNYYFATSD
ncbi:MAG: Ig-like domain-containing protein [Lachnospiraceae bacterium]|nr:Ig-like domain-containing protein [Lachnospiraceae bacterium]